MKRFYFGILCLLIFFGMSIIAYSGSLGTEWQYDAGQAKVSLSIRDKYGDVPYTAVFVVIEPNKNEVRAEKVCRGSENCVAIYPDDFQTTVKIGKSTWKCYVDNKAIIRGSFEYGKTTKSFNELKIGDVRFSNDPKF
jgi:hypothetical protein